MLATKGAGWLCWLDPATGTTKFFEVAKECNSRQGWVMFPTNTINKCIMLVTCLFAVEHQMYKK